MDTYYKEINNDIIHNNYERITIINYALKIYEDDIFKLFKYLSISNVMFFNINCSKYLRLGYKMGFYSDNNYLYKYSNLHKNIKHELNDDEIIYSKNVNLITSKFKVKISILTMPISNEHFIKKIRNLFRISMDLNYKYIVVSIKNINNYYSIINNLLNNEFNNIFNRVFVHFIY